MGSISIYYNLKITVLDRLPISRKTIQKTGKYYSRKKKSNENLACDPSDGKVWSTTFGQIKQWGFFISCQCITFVPLRWTQKFYYFFIFTSYMDRVPWFSVDNLLDFFLFWLHTNEKECLTEIFQYNQTRGANFLGQFITNEIYV